MTDDDPSQTVGVRIGQMATRGASVEALVDQLREALRGATTEDLYDMIHGTASMQQALSILVRERQGF